MAAAPMTAATPMLAAFILAAPVEVVAAGAEVPVVEPLGEEEAVVEVAGFVALELGVVATGLLTLAEVVLPPLAAELEELEPPPPAAVVLEPPEDAEFLPTQLLSLPELIEKAAELAVAPVLSRRVKPMDVPD